MDWKAAGPYDLEGRGWRHSSCLRLRDRTCSTSEELRPKLVTTTLSTRKTNEKSPGIFALVAGAEGDALYVCPYFHNFVADSEALNSTLAKKRVQEKNLISPDSVRIRRGYSKHEYAEWHGNQ